jgi:hypothetical protein
MPQMVIYPNPGNGKITLRQSEALAQKPLKYSIFNSTGTYLLTDYTGGLADANIDISAYPSGLYFIVLYRENGIQTLKYYLIK